MPKDSTDSFRILLKAGFISQVMCDHLAGMVGFRNVLAHEYTKLDLDLMMDVIENHLDDLIAFAQQIVLLFSDTE